MIIGIDQKFYKTTHVENHIIIIIIRIKNLKGSKD